MPEALNSSNNIIGRSFFYNIKKQNSRRALPVYDLAV